jgi:hypothetical protein
VGNQYRYIGSRAEMLANGRPVGPGETFELTDEEIREPHNEMLVADGKIIGVEAEAEHQQTLAERRASRRQSSEASPDDQTGEEA